jgi:dienelactone hydrolase
LGCWGFCWGGRYSVLLGGGDRVLCAIAAHPSGLTMPSNVNDLKKPTLFLCAETDFTFSKANLETTRKILAEKGDDNVVKVRMYYTEAVFVRPPGVDLLDPRRLLL